MSPRRHPTLPSSRKRRIAEPMETPQPPRQPVQQAGTFESSAVTEIEELLPFDRSTTGLTRLKSESSSSSSSSGASSSPDFSLNQENPSDFGFDDELEFLFEGLPPLPMPPPPPPPPRQRTRSAEPAPAILDCLAIEDSIDKLVRGQQQQQKRQRMMSEYQPPAAALSSTAAAQAMLCNVNGLLASARRLNSETSLLKLQAARLVDDVMSSKRRRLQADEKPNSV